MCHSIHYCSPLKMFVVCWVLCCCFEETMTLSYCVLSAAVWWICNNGPGYIVVTDTNSLFFISREFAYRRSDRTGESSRLRESGWICVWFLHLSQVWKLSLFRNILVFFNFQVSSFSCANLKMWWRKGGWMSAMFQSETSVSCGHNTLVAFCGVYVFVPCTPVCMHM